MTKTQYPLQDGDIRRRFKQGKKVEWDDVQDKPTTTSGLGVRTEVINMITNRIDDHTARNDNPHEVTLAQVGGISKTEADGYYQPKGNYQASGDYATTGSVYTKVESDTKYQLKGDYVLASLLTAYYTKTQMDALLLNKVNKANPKTQLLTVAGGIGQMSTLLGLVAVINVVNLLLVDYNKLVVEYNKVRQILIDAELARA